MAHGDTHGRFLVMTKAGRQWLGTWPGQEIVKPSRHAVTTVPGQGDPDGLAAVPGAVRIAGR